MSKVSITRSLLDDLAVSISNKSGEPVPLTLTEMKDAVDDISSTTVEALSVTSNGTYTAPTGKAYTPVTVNVSAPSPSLQSKTYNVSSAGTATVTADSGYDGLSSVSVSVPSATITSLTSPTDWSAGYDFDTASGTFWYWAEMDEVFHPITQSGYISTASTFGVAGATEEGVFQLPTQSATTITPTESEQVAVDANKYTTGQVKVGAISSTYVGSGITQRSASDLTRNAYTVTAPAGYYPEAVSKSVERTTHATPVVSINESTGLITATHSQDQGWVEGSGSGVDVTSKTLQLTTQAATTITPTTSSQTAVAAGKYTTGAVTVAAMPTGTAGTPTATKGTVSNHSVSVTPSVTNTTGYITGGTKTGTAVSVSASELVSGTYTVDSSGTKDVTNYASASIPAGTAGTPSATKGSVSNHSVTVTPSVTNSTGWITGSTKTGTGVSVSASELVSGSETKTENGTYDVTNLAELVVNVSSGTSVKTASGTFSGDGSRDISFTCNFEPDVIYWTSDPGTSSSTGVVAGIIVRGMMAATRYRNNSTSNSHYAMIDITGMNTAGSSYSFRATYSNSTVTLYSFSSNARTYFVNGRTYSWQAVKYTT